MECSRNSHGMYWQKAIRFYVRPFSIKLKLIAIPSAPAYGESVVVDRHISNGWRTPTDVGAYSVTINPLANSPKFSCRIPFEVSKFLGSHLPPSPKARPASCGRTWPRGAAIAGLQPRSAIKKRWPRSLEGRTLSAAPQPEGFTTPGYDTLQSVILWLEAQPHLL